MPQHHLLTNALISLSSHHVSILAGLWKAFLPHLVSTSSSKRKIWGGHQCAKKERQKQSWQTGGSGGASEDLQISAGPTGRKANPALNHRPREAMEKHISTQLLHCPKMGCIQWSQALYPLRALHQGWVALFSHVT